MERKLISIDLVYVTSIGSYAFYECNSLTSIDNFAFDSCSSLNRITYNGTIEQWNAITKGHGWNSNTGDYTIHCADGSIAK